jgi:hypothetical protein
MSTFYLEEGRPIMAEPGKEEEVAGEDIGEGNREADRHYREATERFVKEGKVDAGADEARRALDDPAERRDLEEAEKIGRSRAAEHDPEVKNRG